MKKILVIEDEPEMRRNLVTILRCEKFLPVAAANGREGVEHARKDPPDLVRMRLARRIQMPKKKSTGRIQESSMGRKLLSCRPA